MSGEKYRRCPLRIAACKEFCYKSALSYCDICDSDQLFFKSKVIASHVFWCYILFFANFHRVILS
jgi:hypothetical protein